MQLLMVSSAPARGIALLASFTLLVFACRGDGATGPRRLALVAIVSGDSQTAQVGTPLPEPLVVKVLDSLGAPAARLSVRFGGFGSPVQDSTLTDERGIASIRWTLGEFSGRQFLQATATVHGEMKFASFSATATPGAPTRIVISRGEGAIAVIGTELDTVAVVVMDRFSNLLPATPVNWSVATGGGIVRAHGAVTDSRGAARATWTLGPALGVQTLIVSTADVSQPVGASARPPFVAKDVVVGGAHSCALTDDGMAYCWGSNSLSQLGSGPNDGVAHKIPIAVAGGLRFKSLAAGKNHTCGLSAAGEAYCWGDNNSKQVSNVANRILVSPTPVLGAPTFTMLAAGSSHTCGLTPTAAVFCWGDNAVGQLGIGTDRSRGVTLGALPVATPIRAAGSLTFVTIAAADYITCGITSAGVALCWGANWERALGTDAVGSCVLLEWDFYYYGQEEVHVPCSTSPARVGTDAVLTSLSATSSGVCGVSTMAQLVCWGNGLTPRAIPGANVVRAWRLTNAVCGQQASGAVSCWSLTSLAAVEPFDASLTLVKLGTSTSHSCGLTRDAIAVVYCWGTNEFGQVGDGTLRKRLLPVPVVTPILANASQSP